MPENLEESLSKEKILEMFYALGGDLDKINAAIDAKMAHSRVRKISTFETFIKSRISVNPRILKMARMEISTAEGVYLSQYPGLSEVEVLDLRQNYLGDEGLDAIAHSEVLKNLRELDLRSNQITRAGLESLARSTTLNCLERLDLRLNRLGKRWESKLLEGEHLPRLREVRTV